MDGWLSWILRATSSMSFPGASSSASAASSCLVLAKSSSPRAQEALRIVIQKMFFLQQEIVMFFADRIDALAPWQKFLLEKFREAVNGVFCIIHRRAECGGVPNFTLNFRMVWQAVEKTNAALGTLDGHLCPKPRWIGIRTAEIGDALLDQTGCPVQPAQ